MVFDVPEESDLAVPFWEVVVPAVGAVCIFGAVIVFLLSKSLFRPQVAGAEGLIGSSATVERKIDPEGSIFLHGELWNARAEEPIARGERVRIVGVDDLVMRVARESGEETET